MNLKTSISWKSIGSVKRKTNHIGLSKIVYTKCEQLRACYKMSAVENKHHINDKQVIKCANDQNQYANKRTQTVARIKGEKNERNPWPE